MGGGSGMVGLVVRNERYGVVEWQPTHRTNVAAVVAAVMVVVVGDVDVAVRW